MRVPQLSTFIAELGRQADGGLSPTTRRTSACTLAMVTTVSFERRRMPKVRVYELAKELDVESTVLLRELADLGHPVRSASSPLEPPVIRQVREKFEKAPPPPSQRRSAPRLRPPTGRALIRRPRREWYRGEEPADFVKKLLDRLIVPTRAPDAQAPPNRYWADEVARARELAAEWKGCLLESMSETEMFSWINSGIRADQAIALHRKGIRPDELEWSYEDRDQPPLFGRLMLGTRTVDQVATEMEGRRQRQ